VEHTKIFVVPGICASMLEDRTGGNELVWIDPKGLTVGDDFMALQRNGRDDGDAGAGVSIQAIGLLPLLYGELIAALAESFAASIEPAPYDWRQGIPSSGRTLAARLGAALAADPGVRIALVAHSMGGLVAADALARLAPGDSARIAGLVTLGTPWNGSYDAVLGLTLDGLTAGAFAPFLNLGLGTIRAVLQSFRGLAHLLPAGQPMLLDPAFYAPGPLATDPGLRRGLEEVATLVRRPPSRTISIVSDAFPTFDGVAREGAGLAWTKGAGDGVVPFASAIAAGDVVFEAVRAFHPTMPLYPGVIGKTIVALSQWLGRPRGLAAHVLEAIAGIEGRAPALRFPGALALLGRMPLMGGLHPS
jgi:pimeloyl-ACP methyl ester carboxylesterase